MDLQLPSATGPVGDLQGHEGCSGWHHLLEQPSGTCEQLRRFVLALAHIWPLDTSQVGEQPNGSV